MAVPSFENFMLPMLKLASDGQEHSLAEAREILAKEFDLTEEDREELLPSGLQRVFDNRVAWAKVYLTKAGLLLSTRRAHFKITDRGREVLKDPPEIIKVKDLKKYREFREFQRRPAGSQPNHHKHHLSKGEFDTPIEAIEAAYQEIRTSLSNELLEAVNRCSPSFFENLVLELLVAMGYGGSMKDAARAVGRSGDGGIDGVISEDKLGLDKIYIQAIKMGQAGGVSPVTRFHWGSSG